MSAQPSKERKSDQFDILDRLDFSTLSYHELTECIAKVKSEFERLNAFSAPSIEQMDHKLKILKLWRRLIEFYISVQPSDNDNKIMPEPVVDAIAESVVETVPQQIDHAVKIEPTPNEPTAQNTLRPTSIPRSESDSPSTRPLSAREMAQKIDKTSKYVPIQLLEASFVRGVNMPQGLFIVVEAHEAYDLVKNGKATLLNQS